MSITKQTAALLFAYGFRLVDKEGKEWWIYSVLPTIITIHDDVRSKKILFNQIGTDYWILKRPESQLYTTIEHEGKKIVPIVELAKIAWPHEEWYIYEKHGFSLARTDSPLKRWFDFEDGVFKSGDDEGNIHVKNQQKLFHKKYSLHFIDLPEGTYREINQ